MTNRSKGRVAPNRTQVLTARRAMAIWIAVTGVWSITPVVGRADAPPPAAAAPIAYSDADLLNEVERRAVLYFQEKSDPVTGLTQDRAENSGVESNAAASIASTGYALASLPIAVERQWQSRPVAQATADRTLRFLLAMPRQHGFLYHWVQKGTGARARNSEISTVDTGLLIAGALSCGQYFGGDTLQLAQDLYDRADWNWMLTNGGAKPDKLRLCHGWRPETGFLRFDYGYCEAQLTYLLAMGSATHAVSPAVWLAFGRPVVEYHGISTLHAGPLFQNEMPEEYFDLRGQRDGLGFDYWVAGTNHATIDRLYCATAFAGRTGYDPHFWGLTACDGPDGYQVAGSPDREKGTFGPCAVVAAIDYAPQTCLDSIQTTYRTFGARFWGRYGFGDGYNPERNWCDPYVNSLDLGMAMLAIENHRSGLIWRLMRQNTAAGRALEAAGFHATKEAEPRPLQVTAGPPALR